MEKIALKDNIVDMSEKDEDLPREMWLAYLEMKLESLSPERKLFFYDLIGKFIDQQDGLAN